MSIAEAWSHYLSCQSSKEKENGLINFLRLYFDYDNTCQLEQFCDPISAKNLLVKEFIIELNAAISGSGDEDRRQLMTFLMEGRAVSLLTAISIMLNKGTEVDQGFCNCLIHMIPLLCGVRLEDVSSTADLLSWLPDIDKSFSITTSKMSFTCSIIKKAQMIFNQRYATDKMVPYDADDSLVENKQLFQVPEVCLIVFSILSQLGAATACNNRADFTPLLQKLHEVNSKSIENLQQLYKSNSHEELVVCIFNYQLYLRLLYSILINSWLNSLLVEVIEDVSILQTIISAAKHLVIQISKESLELDEQLDHFMQVIIVIADTLCGTLNLIKFVVSLDTGRQKNCIGRFISQLLTEEDFFHILSFSIHWLDNIYGRSLCNSDIFGKTLYYCGSDHIKSLLIRILSTLTATTASINIWSHRVYNEKFTRQSETPLESSLLLSECNNFSSIHVKASINGFVSKIMLQAFRECQADEISSNILSAIVGCRATCYITPDEIFGCFLDNFHVRSARLKTSILNLLNSIILIECSGARSCELLNRATIPTNTKIPTGGDKECVMRSIDSRYKYWQFLSHYVKLLRTSDSVSMPLLMKHTATLLFFGSEELKFSLLEIVLMPIISDFDPLEHSSKCNLATLECIKLLPLCLYGSKSIQENFVATKQFKELLHCLNSSEWSDPFRMILEFLCLDNESSDDSNLQSLNDVDKLKIISLLLGRAGDDFVMPSSLHLMERLSNQVVVNDHEISVKNEFLSDLIENEQLKLLTSCWCSFWRLYRSCPLFRENFSTLKLQIVAFKCLVFIAAYTQLNVIKRRESVVEDNEMSDTLKATASDLHSGDDVDGIGLASYDMSDVSHSISFNCGNAALQESEEATGNSSVNDDSEINWQKWLLFDNIVDRDVGSWVLSNSHFGDQLALIIHVISPLLGICLDCAASKRLVIRKEILNVHDILQEMLPLFYQISSISVNLSPDISETMLTTAIDQSTTLGYYSQQDMISLLIEKFEVDAHGIFNVDTPIEARKTPFVDDDYEADIELETDDNYPINMNDAENISEVEVTYIADSDDQRLMSRNTVPTIVHPDVVASAMEILAYKTSLAPRCNKECLHRMINKLLAVCANQEENRLALCKLGFLGLVLNRLYYIFSSSSEEFADVKRSLYSLYSTLASSSISPIELRTSFYLIKTVHHTEEFLIEALRLALSSFHTRPLHFISFPFVDNTFLPIEDDDNFTLRLPANVAPVQLPLEGQFIWPNTSGGFSLSFWIKTSSYVANSSSRVNLKLQKTALSIDLHNKDKVECHILSIGSAKAMFEIWTSNGESLTMKWTISDTTYEDRKTVEEYHLNNVLQIGEWQHICIAYSVNEEILNQGQLQCWRNGAFFKKVPFMYPEVKKSTFCNMLTVYIGNTVNKNSLFTLTKPESMMGNVLIFYDRALKHQEALHLYAMGPDNMHIFNAIITQKISEVKPTRESSHESDESSHLYKDDASAFENVNVPLANWTSIWYSRVLNSKFLKNPEVRLSGYFLGMEYVSSASLQENLVAAFFARSPQVYHQYLLPTIKENRSSKFHIVLERRKQIERSVALATIYQVSCYPTFHSAIYQFGNLATLLYMFASSVERNLNEYMQASILSMIFHVSKSDFYYSKEMIDRNGYLMLQKALLSMKGIGFKVLQVLLNSACTEKLLVGSCSSDYQISLSNSALIQDVHILHYLLLDHTIWLENEVIWEILMLSLASLVSSRSPHQWFNIRKLQQARFVELFFLAVQEQQQTDRVKISMTIIRHHITIIESMLGSPPDIVLLEDLFDFLIAIHHSTDVRVLSHRNDFYFFSLGTISVDENLKALLPQKRSKSFSDQADNVSVGKQRTMSDSVLVHSEFDGSPKDDDDDDKSITSGQEVINFNTSSPRQHDAGTFDIDKFGDEIKFNVNGQGKLANTSYDDEDFIPPTSISSIEVNDAGSNSILMSLRLMLLDILDGAFINLPDAQLEHVFGRKLRLATLLILAGNSAVEVKAATVKILWRYFERFQKQEIDNFNKIHGFHILAKQVYKGDPDVSLINNCFSTLLNVPVDIQQRKCIPYFAESITRDRCLAIIPILSLLNGCFVDPTLLIATLTFLNDLLSVWPDLITTSIENGLPVVLCKLVRSLNICDESSCEMATSEFKCISQCLLRSFFIIIHHSCQSAENHHFQYLTDLMALLCELYEEEKSRAGVRSNAVRYVKSLRCFILKCAIKCLWRIDAESLENSMKSSLSFPDGFVDILQDSIRKEDVGMQASAGRFGRVCVLSVNLSIATCGTDSDDEIDDFEVQFISSTFQILINCLVAALDPLPKSTDKTKFIQSIKGEVRTQFQRLLFFLLSPSRTLELKKITLLLIRDQQVAKKTIIDLLGSFQTPEMRDLLGSCLHDFKVIETENKSDILRLCRIAAECGIDIAPLSSENVLPNLMDFSCAAWKHKQAQICNRINERFSLLDEAISRSAIVITEQVSNYQHQQKKKLYRNLHHKSGREVHCKKAWKYTVDQVTHERAIWWDPEYYPKSWELDPTEGPIRERRRLRKCHLILPKKFFLPKFRNRSCDKPKYPLEFIFGSCIDNSRSTIRLEDCIGSDDQLKHNCYCSYIIPENKAEGEFLIGEFRLYFMQDTMSAASNATKKLFNRFMEPLIISWTYEEITEIHKRRYSLQNNGLEIFLTNGNTHLLSFNSHRERNEMLAYIVNTNKDKLINFRNYDQIKATVTQKWRDGKITNFEYLMQLNKIAGRSFNDLMQYPIFPFILSDYQSDCLDLENQESFRDLSKPIAAQNEDRAKKYVENYKLLKDEFDRGLSMGQSFESGLPTEPYHYGSHYSNSGTVLHFLVRLPPYTHMFVDYQDQSFDIPDRTFHSMVTTWRLSSYESTTDVKEMIPEFFYLSNFLTNTEGFNFGKRQTGEQVNDITLPPWCENNARLFILVHRQALESDYVSRYLNKWIDLIFGFKQTGKEAIDAINVFHPSTYKAADIDNIKEPIKRNAYLTMINTYGQTPIRLFRNPHVERAPLVDQGAISAIIDSGAALLAQISGRFAEEKAKSDEIFIIPSIKGLKWGNYIGSPNLPEPVTGWSSQALLGKTIKKIKYIKSPSGDYIVSLGSNTELFCTVVKKPGSNEGLLFSALMCWSNVDNVIRMTTSENSLFEPLFEFRPSDQVTCTTTVVSLNLILIGGIAGVISCWKLNADTSSLQLIDLETNLYGHFEKINCLASCEPYKIFVSGSDDRTCIIWDLNRLNYIRSIAGYPSGITAIAISSTTGDIASACKLRRKSTLNTDHGSLLKLCDINGSLIVTCTCDYSITCLAYTNAPEGISVNVIVGGLSNGNVRMWNSWNLAVIRDISLGNTPSSPVVSLDFNSDYSQLYVGYHTKIQAWRKKDQFHKKPAYHHHG